MANSDQSMYGYSIDLQDITGSANQAFGASGLAEPTNKGAIYFMSGTLKSKADAVNLAGSLQLASSTAVSSILDEDDLNSDSATALATQQSIKAYVDAQVTAQDLDFATDSGTGTVDLDSQTLTLAGAAGLDVTHSGQTVTYALDLAELSAETAIASGDTFAFVQESESGDPSKKITFDNMASKLAGVGLAASAGVLAADLNELSAAAVDVSADSIAIIDANDSNASRKESIADLVTAMAGTGLAASNGVLNADLNEASGADIAVGSDSILFIDADDSNNTKKESVADLMTAAAGNGLGASSGVLAVNVDGTGIEINSDTLRLKDSGVTLAKMANLANMKVLGNVSGGTAAPAAVSILDEDNMASDSATAIATQQSIKAYVDAQVTAQDLDVAGDSGTGAVDLDSQSLTIAGTANEIETSASGQTITVGLPNDVTIGQDLTVTRNATVTGNLTVNGTQFKVDGETVVIDDSLVEMATVNKAAPGSSTMTKDKGHLLHHHNGTAASIQFIGYDVTNDGGKFVVKAGVTDDGDGSISGGSYAPFKAGNIEGADLTMSGDLAVTGDVGINGNITLAGASDTAIDMAADSLYFRDADGTLHRDTVADIMTAAAGDGLGAASGVLKVDVSDFAGTGLEDDGSENLRIAAAAAGDGLSGGGGSALALDLNELTAATVDVANDSIAIIDATDNGSKKESIVDLAAGMAGTGISASGGQLSANLGALIAGDTADRVLTADGDGTMTAEANMTFNGTTFSLGHSSPAGIMLTGSIAIEANALPDTLYAIDVANTAGNGPNSRVRANAFVTYSARELKSDIKDISNPMAKLNALRPVTYNWKHSDVKAKGWKSQEVGFIADEVQQVLPQIVATSPEGKAQGIDYSKLTAVLTQAVKNQDQEIQDLKAQLSKVLKALELKG